MKFKYIVTIWYMFANHNEGCINFNLFASQSKQLATKINFIKILLLYDRKETRDNPNKVITSKCFRLLWILEKFKYFSLFQKEKKRGGG